MSSSALLSCLGVSGWGPLHWWLGRDGEPEAVLARLRQAWRLAVSGGAPDPRASLLLAGLLRSSTDLIPLATASLLHQRVGLVFRHRLVCRPGERWLHLRTWECRSAALPWRSCGLEQRLDASLLSDHGSSDRFRAAGVGGEASRGRASGARSNSTAACLR